MRTSHLSLVVALAMAGAAAIAAQQTVTPVAGGAAPGPQTPPADARGKGVIAGQVVDADSGRGVPAAVVRLGPPLMLLGASGMLEESLSAYTSGMRYVIADTDGRFVIRNVPAGSHVLVHESSGYMRSAFGHQRPGGQTREVIVEVDQRVIGVVIKAWKTAVITGTVIDEAGEPAIGVTVSAFKQSFSGGRRMFSPGLDSTRTDDRGEYRLSDLDPGDYVVVVASTSVTVPAATLTSYREAVAAGGGAASAISRDAAGLGASLTSPAILTVDGHTLLAGTRARGLALPGVVAGTAVYETTFYPATTAAVEGGIVTAKSGEVRSGIDVRLKLSRAFSVSGTVTSPDGTAGPYRVMLMSAASEMVVDTTGHETATTLSTADGRFLFLGVPEGQHVIKVTRIQRSTPAQTSTTALQVGGETRAVTSVSASAPATASRTPTLWARVPLTVSGHLTGVSVALANGARVSGRVEFEGATTPPVAGPGGGGSVTLVAADGHVVGEFPVARPGADRRFETAQFPPGRYYMSATPIGKWLLKSITINGKDALKLPFSLGADDIGDAVVTFTDRAAELSGVVRDRNGAPVNGAATIALFPADYRAWIDGGMSARMLRVADAAQDGTFRLTDLMPGDYLAVAYPSGAARAPQDPAFIAELAQAATRVVVGDGSKGTLTLTTAVVR